MTRLTLQAEDVAGACAANHPGRPDDEETNEVNNVHELIMHALAISCARAGVV